MPAVFVLDQAEVSLSGGSTSTRARANIYAAFRVDASAQIGTGHLMRCLTLADALRKSGAEVRFVSRHMPEHLRTMVREGGHEFTLLHRGEDNATDDRLPHARWLGTSQAIDAQDTVQALSDLQWDWLVVDHYALDAQWERALYGTAKRILVIDDLADRLHDCDLLLDQNFYSDTDARYVDKVPTRCKLLLGPRYALLREEFRRLHTEVRARSGPVRSVLVCFGGVDAENHTARSIEALAGIGSGDLQVQVVIGAQHPARAEIQALCARYGYACHVQTARMAELIVAADMAVGAGGAATWERCCLGLPTLTLCLADNQRKLIEDSARSGLLYALAHGCDQSGLRRHIQSLIENPGLRELISRNGIDTVDGRGTLRVLRKMGCSAIKVRPASESDSSNLKSWRNHPAIRAVSRNSELITDDEHERWLEAVLRDGNRALLIGYRDQQPVGVVRFDMEGDCAEVSIYLVPGLDKQGLGIELLDSAEQWLRSNHSVVKRLRADVLGDNAPSHRLFRSGGYVNDSTCYSKEVR